MSVYLGDWGECLEMLSSWAKWQSIDWCAIVARITVLLWCACWENIEPIFADGLECRPGVSNCHIMQGFRIVVQCRLFVAHSQKHVWSCSLRWHHFDAFRCHEWCASKQCRKGSWEHVCLCECRSQKSIYSMQWLLHCVLSRRYVQFWIVMNSIYIPTSVRAMLG